MAAGDGDDGVAGVCVFPGGVGRFAVFGVNVRPVAVRGRVVGLGAAGRWMFATVAADLRADGVGTLRETAGRT